MHSDISRRLMLHEITEVEANELRKMNPCPFDFWEVEYQCELYKFIGVSVTQQDYLPGFSMEEYMDNVKKMKVKSISKK